jgi:hypothetical protein
MLCQALTSSQVTSLAPLGLDLALHAGHLAEAEVLMRREDETLAGTARPLPEQVIFWHRGKRLTGETE